MIDPLSPTPPKIELVFYQSESGKEPVRDWLIKLPEANRRAVGLDLQRVQYRWPVGMPLVRPMGKGLFEVRTNLPDGTISRVLFCFHGGELYALHGFVKKTEKTAENELALARKRQKEVTHG
jgi:phage-related protein